MKLRLNLMNEAANKAGTRYTFNIQALLTDNMKADALALNQLPEEVRQALADAIVNTPSNQIIITDYSSADDTKAFEYNLVLYRGNEQIRLRDLERASIAVIADNIRKQRLTGFVKTAQGEIDYDVDVSASNLDSISYTEIALRIRNGYEYGIISSRG